MEPFTRLTSIAAPLWLDGIETDQIIPARLCVRPAGADYGDTLFAPWRYLDDGAENPQFVLNREPFRHAEILVAGANFGFGSSREHAAWAVRDFGIRAIVAPSFASIFRTNSVRSGVLPVTLPVDAVQEIVDELRGEPAELTVDLAEQVVVAPSGRTHAFEVAPLDKAMLLEGVDAIGLVARHADEVASFQDRDRARRPWIYETVSRVS
jgi:3-isopropylmalate/(R)-2-methylmalate dehydratase small subunit